MELAKMLPTPLRNAKFGSWRWSYGAIRGHQLTSHMSAFFSLPVHFGLWPGEKMTKHLFQFQI